MNQEGKLEASIESILNDSVFNKVFCRASAKKPAYRCLAVALSLPCHVIWLSSWAGEYKRLMGRIT